MGNLKIYWIIVLTVFLSLFSNKGNAQDLSSSSGSLSTSSSSSSGNIVAIKEPALKQVETISIQEDPTNELGLIYSVKKIEEAKKLIETNSFQEAEQLLIQINDWLISSSEYHYELFQTFSKNYKEQDKSKLEKAHALDFANLRDQCYFLLAKTYISQSKTKPAIKLLVDIIKSQPDSELSLKAYKLIQDIKFSDKQATP